MSAPSWEIAKRLVLPDTSEFNAPPKQKTLANTRLTALTGLLLFVLLAVEGITVPFVGQLFTLHAFIGWVLVPPMALKLASTSYRFVMYYTGNPRYVKAGPPQPLLRILAPLVIISTAVLMWSGVELVLIGPNATTAGLWKTIHQASFVLWFGFMTIHVLAYVLKAGSISLPELRIRQSVHSIKVPGRNIRVGLLIVSILLGILIGFHESHLAQPWIKLFTSHGTVRAVNN